MGRDIGPASWGGGGGGAVSSVNGETGAVVIDKSDVGLSNVTNDAQLPLAGGTMDSGAFIGFADDMGVIEMNGSYIVDSTKDRVSVDGIEADGEIRTAEHVRMTTLGVRGFVYSAPRLMLSGDASIAIFTSGSGDVTLPSTGAGGGSYRFQRIVNLTSGSLTIKVSSGTLYHMDGTTGDVTLPAYSYRDFTARISTSIYEIGGGSV